MIKRALAIAITSAILVSCGGSKVKTDTTDNATYRIIRIKGSETVRPIIEKIAPIYMKNHSDIVIDYQGGGSNIGIMALKQDETDLAFCSRELGADDWSGLDKNMIISGNIGFDGLTVVTNLANKVNQLTLEQLAGLYSGKIKSWKDVGGEDGQIVIYSRDISSGTYSFFKDHVLKDLEYSHDDINITHNDEIVKNVAQQKNAIGYVGSGCLIPNVKAIKLSSDGKEFYDAGFQNIKSKIYPLCRPLTYIYNKKDSALLADFIMYLKSPEVKQIVNETGFISE